MNVLVTGANGFLGRHVVAALRGRGHRVRALVRPAARLEDLGWPAAVEVFRGDLRASGDLDAAFAGVDVLVHLAAAVSGSEEAQFASGVVGTERLLAAMARSRTRRLVLCSSFSVYDWSAIRGALDESSPLEQAPDLYQRDGYAIAKSWQERVTRRMAAEHRWDLTVVRPGFIWGRDHGYVAGVGQRFGRLHLVIAPWARLPLIHVENCADLFAAVVESPRAAGETLNAVDCDGTRVWQCLGDHLRGTGQRGIRVPVPYRLAWLAVRLARALSRWVFRGKGKLPSILVPCRFEARFKPLRYSNRRAREVLGWRPRLDYRACLERTYGTAGPAPAAPQARSTQRPPSDDLAAP